MAQASTNSPSALVDFVLQHAHVQTHVCTRQTTDHYTLEPRTLRDYNFIFITLGRVVWVIDGEDVPLSPGRLVIVPPGVPHHAYSQTRHVCLYSYHTQVSLPGGGDVFDLLIPPRVQHVPRDCPLDRYLRGAALEFNRDDAWQSQLMFGSWVRLIVLELLRHDAEAGQLTHRNVDPLIVQMLEALNHRIDRPTTLDDLASVAGFSAQHLNRVFNRLLGMTPLQYLTRLRMQHAAALLTDGRLTLRAIAEAVGYDDPYYFSRLFKQHVGRSPAQYRNDASSDYPSSRSPAPFSTSLP